MLQQALLCARQGIEARRDHAVHRLRHLGDRPPLVEHPRELLRKERVAAGAFEERRMCVGPALRPAERLTTS